MKTPKIMRCSGVILGWAMLLLAAPARAGDSGSAFDTANRAFAEGNTAARGYEAVIAKQGYSAPVLFNLANAQSREGKLGLAILNYERALWLAPRDPDIAANLELARRKAGLEPRPNSRFQLAAQALTFNSWSWLAAFTLLMLAAGPLLRRLMPRTRLALNAGMIIGAGAFVAAIAALGARCSELDRAVVTVPEAAARVSPVTVAPPLFTLRAGERVTLKQSHGPFALIAGRAGQEGWVKTDDITVIIPP